jgi:hypothetical protein
VASCENNISLTVLYRECYCHRQKKFRENSCHAKENGKNKSDQNTLPVILNEVNGSDLRATADPSLSLRMTSLANRE